MRDTRGALVRWNREPALVLRPWFLGALGFAVGLLVAVLVVASLAPPDLTPAYIPGVWDDADIYDVGRVLFRNGLVLALHAVACVAGFIAGSSLPLQADQMSGWRRWIHDKATAARVRMGRRRDLLLAGHPGAQPRPDRIPAGRAVPDLAGAADAHRAARTRCWS